jgi:hypothetical protein
MHCFTPTECSKWLQEHSIFESPYGNRFQEMRFQIEPPRNPRSLIQFTRGLFDTFGEFPGALLQFIDWNTHNADETAMIDSLRRGHGEKRWLIDAPGHLFASHEIAEAIGHCYLTTIFDWSAYLYPASGIATVYFWEGDLIDFWSNDDLFTRKIEDLVKNYDLRVIGNTH